MEERRENPVLGVLRSYLPILTWGAEYSGRTLGNDLIAGGDRHDHADPAVAGLRAAGGPAAAGRALRLDGAARALRDLRHLARARGRPRGGGQPDDRGRRGSARDPGDAGVPGRRHRARHDHRAHPARHGPAAAGISRELPQPPGHLGFHHGREHPDRGRPARAGARHRRERRESAPHREIHRAQISARSVP